VTAVSGRNITHVVDSSASRWLADVLVGPQVEGEAHGLAVLFAEERLDVGGEADLFLASRERRQCPAGRRRCRHRRRGERGAGRPVQARGQGGAERRVGGQCRVVGCPGEPGQLAGLLASCDQDTAAGRRDFAILTLLARLGLRAGEVAALTLDDLDWRAGEITVRGKGSRRERLPLPADVGEAIAGYLRAGRPEPFEAGAQPRRSGCTPAPARSTAPRGMAARRWGSRRGRWLRRACLGSAATTMTMTVTAAMWRSLIVAPMG